MVALPKFILLVASRPILVAPVKDVAVIVPLLLINTSFESTENFKERFAGVASWLKEIFPKPLFSV